jgi:hypothetical protein
MFSLFNKQNGPSITGRFVSCTFVSFKTSFESFLLHASHYFNSSGNPQIIRRFSPLVEFGSALFEHWGTLVSRLNQLSCSRVLPHLHQFQVDFELLGKEVRELSASQHPRSYYRDRLFSVCNYVKHTLAHLYGEIYEVLSHEHQGRFNEQQAESLRNQILFVSRLLQEDFMSVFPSNMRSRPEMNRSNNVMQTLCSDVLYLLESSYYYRSRLNGLQHQMSDFQLLLCGLFDRLGISYRINVQPIISDIPVDIDDVFEDESRRGTETEPETTVVRGEHRLEIFVNGVGDLLQLDFEHGCDSIDKLKVIERELCHIVQPCKGASVHKGNIIGDSVTQVSDLRFSGFRPRQSKSRPLRVVSHVQGGSVSVRTSVSTISLSSPKSSGHKSSDGALPKSIPPPPPSPVSSVVVLSADFGNHFDHNNTAHCDGDDSIEVDDVFESVVDSIPDTPLASIVDESEINKESELVAPAEESI